MRILIFSFHSILPILLLLASGCTGGEHGSLQTPPSGAAASGSADTIVAGSADTIPPMSAPGTDSSRTALRPDFERFFAEQNAEGCFVLYDMKQDSFIRYNPARCDSAFIPASTFKIFNSLVALETGVLTDENMVIKWDGVKRGGNGWDQDQTMRTAFQRSAVWFYQEAARRIGEKRMRYYVEREGYGNGNIGGGIDQFWLRGDLRITPNQQVEFLKRLYKGELGFSKRSIDIIKDVMKMEEKPAYTLRGKTGWGLTANNGNIGWLVGYLERKESTYIFALNLGSRGKDYPMMKARMTILQDIFKELKLM